MSEKSPETREIAPRELESLLRGKFGQDVELLRLDYGSLLPAGENYGSSIFKVRALVKTSGAAREERTLELVAKMPPPSDFQRLIFDSAYSFRKEAFLYEELIPSYRRLEREHGVAEEEAFDIVPEFFGARYSLSGAEDDFDDDAVLLMQNLKVMGYYTADRREGLDYEHAEIAIKALARFHALGIAMKQLKPDYFATLKLRSKCITYPENTGFEDMTVKYQDMIAEDPEISRYLDACKLAMSEPSATDWSIPSDEPWATIIHSDFWVNNIMFHRDQRSNRVDDVKFVDFQNYLYLSPLRELSFFLTVSGNGDVLEHRFDELLDAYHETFVGRLARLGCDVEDFRRDKFDARLRLDAYAEFGHCPYMLKVSCAEVKSDEKFDSVEKFKATAVGDEGRFRDRLRRCVKKFAEKRWLDKPSTLA